MITAERIYEVFNMIDKIEFYNKAIPSVLKASPKMLIALINEAINFDYSDLTEENSLSIEAIESTDSQKRKWSEIKKVLCRDHEF